MKKIILGMTVLAVAAAGVQTAKAGDRFLAAEIFTGLAVASAIHHAVALERHAPVCYPPPVACGTCTYPFVPPFAPRQVFPNSLCCAPAPVVVYRAPVFFPPAPVVCAPAPRWEFRPRHGGEHRRSEHGRW